MWIDPLRARIDTATAEERLFAEFLIEWAQARGELLQALAELERDPASPGALHALFRALHSQKSGLRMLRLDAAADLVHALEDVLQPVRDGRLPLGDSLRQLLDRSGRLLEQSLHLHGLQADAHALDLHPVTRGLQRLPPAGTEREAQLAVLQVLLDPWNAEVVQGDEASQQADLDMFRRIGGAAEARLQRESEGALWREQIAKRLQAASGNPLPPLQVQAAALLWNVGRAQLPADLRLLERAPADAPRAAVWRAHPEVAAAFLDARPQWRDCARLLGRQLESRAAGPSEPLSECVDLLRAVAAWVAAGGRQTLSETAERGARARLGADVGWLEALLAVLDRETR